MLFSAKTISDLGKKFLRKRIQAGETQPDISPTMRPINCAENPIPNPESKAEIDAIFFSLRQIPGVMPDMHFRTIKNIFHERRKNDCRKQSTKTNDPDL